MPSELPESGYQPDRLRDLFDVACDLEGPSLSRYLDENCAGQPALRAALEKLLRADREGVGRTLWQTTAAAAEAREMAAQASLPFERLGEYRILSRIGAGGMGAVYLAERDYDDVRRRVAIKIIPRVLVDDDLLRRFRQERQILARMEHPNIARMLDAGRTPDGMPFLAMEYIDGIPLDEYAAARHLGLKERVALFHGVCSAVAYAHRNLVVHRDLKPQNILVTAEGVPKLLDFGIAKILSAAEPGAEPARTEAFAMTLDYASPEQLTGMPITTASDIYSLGVVLYQLMTGRRPYALASKSLEEIVRLVCQEPAVPPASVDRALAGDLDAIICKAIRKEPEQRYASAGELARDLERYLAGDPVSASGVSFVYLARKYVARHKSQAAALAAAAILLVAGIVGVSWEARIANRERATAQRRFDTLRMLASDMVFQTNENLARYPGTTEARKALIARGLAYLEVLARDAGGDPTLQRDLGAAYIRMGDIQGKEGVATLGDWRGAMASYQKAGALLIAAVAKNPHDLEARLHLVDVYNSLSYSYWSLRNQTEREKSAQLAVAAAEGAVRENPGNLRARKALASAYFAHAGALNTTDQAIEAWRKCLELYLSLLSAKPQGDEELRNVALVHKYLAGVYQERSRLGEALEQALEAEKADSLRLVAQPSNLQTQLDVTFDLNQIASAYDALGDQAKALESYRRALEIRRKLSAADPKDFWKRERLIYSETSVGKALLKTGGLEESGQHFRAAAAIGAEEIARKPADKELQSMTGEVYAGLSDVADRSGRPREACSWLRRAIAMNPKLASARAARMASCGGK